MCGVLAPLIRCCALQQAGVKVCSCLLRVDDAAVVGNALDVSVRPHARVRAPTLCMVDRNSPATDASVVMSKKSSTWYAND